MEPGTDRCLTAAGISGPASWHVFRVTIYQAVYHGGQHGLTRQLHCTAAHWPAVPEARGRPMERTTRFVAQGFLIDQMPRCGEDSSRVGDWDCTAGLPLACREIYLIEEV